PPPHPSFATDHLSPPNNPAATALYTLSLPDALPIYQRGRQAVFRLSQEQSRWRLACRAAIALAFERPLVRLGQSPYRGAFGQLRDRKSTRLNSSHVKTSYAVFCLKQKNHGRMQRRAF